MARHSVHLPDQTDLLCIDGSFAGRVEILRTRFHSQRFPRHAHDTAVVGLGLEGAGSIWYRGRNHERVPGDVVVIPPDEVHTGGVGPGADVLSYLAVYLPSTTWSACAATAGIGIDECPDFRAPVIRDHGVAVELRRLYDVLWPARAATDQSTLRITPPDIDSAAAEEAIVHAVGRLVQRHGRSRSRADGATYVGDAPQLVRSAREILEDCYADHTQTSVGALARRAGVTPFHLIRSFTRATGVSPHQYLLQVRVRHARQLLAGGRPPAIAAAMAGFVDQSQMTMHFKRYTGITPAHYQRCLGAPRMARGTSGYPSRAARFSSGGPTPSSPPASCPRGRPDTTRRRTL